MKYLAIAFIAVVALPVAWRLYWKHPYIKAARLDDSFEFMHEPDIDPDYKQDVRTTMYEYIFGKQDGL